jgi:hypothetical protein
MTSAFKPRQHCHQDELGCRPSSLGNEVISIPFNLPINRQAFHVDFNRSIVDLRTLHGIYRWQFLDLSAICQSNDRACTIETEQRSHCGIERLNRSIFNSKISKKSIRAHAGKRRSKRCTPSAIRRFVGHGSSGTSKLS